MRHVLPAALSTRRILIAFHTQVRGARLTYTPPLPRHAAEPPQFFAHLFRAEMAGERTGLVFRRGLGFGLHSDEDRASARAAVHFSRIAFCLRHSMPRT